jgi:hypothetical protein
MNNKNLLLSVLLVSTTLGLSACGGSSNNVVVDPVDPTPVSPTPDPEPPTPVPDPTDLNPIDGTPDNWALSANLYNSPSEVVLSETITISGIDNPIDISIIDGEYRVNDGEWTDVAGKVVNGDTVTVRVTSPDTYVSRSGDGEPIHSFTTSVLTIADLNGLFYVENGQEPDGDITPDSLTIDPVTNTRPEVEVLTTFTLTGVDGYTLVSLESGTVVVDGEEKGASTLAAPDSEIGFKVSAPDDYGMTDNIAFLVGDTLGSFDVSTYATAPDDLVLSAIDCETQVNTICYLPETIEVVTWADDGETITGRYTPTANEALVIPSDEDSLNVSIIVDLSDIDTATSPIYVSSFVDLAVGEYDLFSMLNIPTTYFTADTSCETVTINLLGATGDAVNLKAYPNNLNARVTDLGDLSNGQRTIAVEHCDTDSLYIEDILTDDNARSLQASATVTLDGTSTQDATLRASSELAISATNGNISYVATLLDNQYRSSFASNVDASTAALNVDHPSAKYYSVFAESTSTAGSDSQPYSLVASYVNADVSQPLDITFDNARAVLSNADDVYLDGALAYTLEGSSETSFVTFTLSYAQAQDSGFEYITHNVYVTPSVERFSGDETVTVPTLDEVSLSRAVDPLGSKEPSIFIEVLSYTETDGYDSLESFLDFTAQSETSAYKVAYSLQIVD